MVYFRVTGKEEPIKRNELIKKDPMSLVLFYEKKIRIINEE